MAVYQAIFIYFCQNIIYFVLLFFVDNLRNLEKKIMTWGKLFFLITWHNLYTSEKLSLCRLKAVKGYLLSYQYFSFPLNPPTYFWRIFLEEWQPCCWKTTFMLHSWCSFSFDNWIIDASSVSRYHSFQSL